MYFLLGSRNGCGRKHSHAAHIIMQTPSYVAKRPISATALPTRVTANKLHWHRLHTDMSECFHVHSFLSPFPPFQPSSPTFCHIPLLAHLEVSRCRSGTHPRHEKTYATTCIPPSQGPFSLETLHGVETKATDLSRRPIHQW